MFWVNRLFPSHISLWCCTTVSYATLTFVFYFADSYPDANGYNLLVEVMFNTFPRLAGKDLCEKEVRVDVVLDVTILRSGSRRHFPQQSLRAVGEVRAQTFFFPCR